jgi:hypothetical protein
MNTHDSKKVIKGPDFNTDAPLAMKDLIDFYSTDKGHSMGG